MRHSQHDEQRKGLGSRGDDFTGDDELDPTLQGTFHQMQRLYADQRQRPDEQFVRQLENTLMPNPRTAPAPPPGLQGAIDRLADGIRLRLPTRPFAHGLSTLNSAVSVAILVALIATTALIAFQPSWPGGNGEPTHGAFAPAGSPEASAELPILPPGVRWLYDGGSLADGKGFGGMVLANGSIYRLVETPSFVGVEAIDAASGTLRWRQPASWSRSGPTPTDRIYGGLAADDQHVYYFSGTSQGVQALDAATGEPVWSNGIPGAGVSIEIDNGELYVWDDLSILTKYDATTGDVTWSIDSANGGDPLAVAGPFISGDVVLTMADIGTVTAYDRVSGSERWSYQDDLDLLNVSIAEWRAPETANEAASASPQRIIVIQALDFTTRGVDAQRGKVLAALDPTDGALLWREEVPSGVGMNVIVAGDRLIHLEDVISPDATPTAIASPATGSPALADSEGQGQSLPTMVVARDIETGEVAWTSESSPPESFYRSVATVDDGMVLGFTNDGRLATLNAEDGQALCPPMQPDLLAGGFTLVDGSTLYIASMDGPMIAFDLNVMCPPE